MSYKFDSLITILNKLDRGEKITVGSLMEELDISERTSHRYLETLLVAGFPIEYDRTRQTYVFTDGYTLRRPNLTVEEMLAFSLAKKLLGNFGPGMEQSLHKLEERLAMKKTDMPKHIVLSAEDLPARIGEYLGSIHQATMNFQRIEITHQALYSDRVTKRKVDPYYLFFQDEFWHLRAYCNLRKDFRTFALDRIISLKVLNEHFVPQRIAQDEELSGAFSAFLDGEPAEVVLRFDAEMKPVVMRKKWHRSETTRQLADGRLEVIFNVSSAVGIKEWIYRWIPFVEVMKPAALKEEMRVELEKALARFTRTSSKAKLGLTAAPRITGRKQRKVRNHG
jgi:predicted DNA-binding transcriptional regulator YafY